MGDISGFIDSLLGKKMVTVNEEIGLFGGTVIVAIIILVIGALSGSESILGFGMVVGIPVGISSLISVLLGGDNMSNRSSDKEEFTKPGTEFKIGDQEYVMNATLDTLSSRQKYNLGENKVLEDTIKYKGETNNFIVLDNGDGTYTLLKKEILVHTRLLKLNNNFPFYFTTIPYLWIWDFFFNSFKV
jgi:hypothetical protein